MACDQATERIGRGEDGVLIDQRDSSDIPSIGWPLTRLRAAGFLVVAMFAMACGSGFAADLTFNITHDRGSESVSTGGWIEFLLGRCLGRKRLCLRRLGSWVLSIVCCQGYRDFQYQQCRRSDVSASARASSSASTRRCSGASYAATTYYGSEMEDVEVYDGIGYFSSDVNGSNGERASILSTFRFRSIRSC